MPRTKPANIQTPFTYDPDNINPDFYNKRMGRKTETSYHFTAKFTKNFFILIFSIGKGAVTLTAVGVESIHPF